MSRVEFQDHILKDHDIEALDRRLTYVAETSDDPTEIVEALISRRGGVVGEYDDTGTPSEVAEDFAIHRIWEILSGRASRRGECSAAEPAIA